MADIERSRRAANDIISGTSGTVLIGTGPVFVPVVSAAVHDMISEHPSVDFSIVQGHNAALRSALMANAIDLFVGMISGAGDSGEFRTRQLISDKIVCVCRKDHRLLRGRPVATDLLEYGWVLPEEGETGRTMLEAFFRNRNLPTIRVKITTNSDRVARYFLQRTDLIGLSPRSSSTTKSITTLPPFRSPTSRSPESLASCPVRSSISHRLWIFSRHTSSVVSRCSKTLTLR